MKPRNPLNISATLYLVDSALCIDVTCCHWLPLISSAVISCPTLLSVRLRQHLTGRGHNLYLMMGVNQPRDKSNKMTTQVIFFLNRKWFQFTGNKQRGFEKSVSGAKSDLYSPNLQIFIYFLFKENKSSFRDNKLIQ